MYFDLSIIHYAGTANQASILLRKQSEPTKSKDSVIVCYTTFHQNYPTDREDHSLCIYAPALVCHQGPDLEQEGE